MTPKKAAMVVAARATVATPGVVTKRGVKNAMAPVAVVAIPVPVAVVAIPAQLVVAAIPAPVVAVAVQVQAAVVPGLNLAVAQNRNYCRVISSPTAANLSTSRLARPLKLFTKNVRVNFMVMHLDV